MAKVTGSKYELEYIAEKSMFFIKVWGFYTEEDAQAFLKDYSAETKKINPRITTLVINSTDLVTSKPEAKILLIECIKLYMQLPYKNRLFIKPKSSTANLMIKNAMKDAGMIDGKDGLLIESMQAVEEYIKSH